MARYNGDVKSMPALPQWRVPAGGYIDPRCEIVGVDHVESDRFDGVQERLGRMLRHTKLTPNVSGYSEQDSYKLAGICCA